MFGVIVKKNNWFEDNPVLLLKYTVTAKDGSACKSIFTRLFVCVRELAEPAVYCKLSFFKKE